MPRDLEDWFLRAYFRNLARPIKEARSSADKELSYRMQTFTGVRSTEPVSDRYISAVAESGIVLPLHFNHDAIPCPFVTRL
jgi:hypothetical protein